MNMSLLLVTLLAASVFSTTATAWPTQHPDGAAHARIENYSTEKYDAYFWWDGGKLYFEADPVSGNPFICDVDFTYIQDGKQGDVSLTDSGNSSFCSDLFVKTILHVTGYGSVIDSSLDTTIINNYDVPVYIQIPKSDGTGPTPGVPAVSLSSLAATKIVCKSKGSKVNATQTGDDRFSCDGLVVNKNGKVTITISGKLAN